MAPCSWNAAIIAVIASLCIPVVSSQNVSLLPTTATQGFPTCGLSCSLLKQAQDACVPPVAQKSDQWTYISCFCQSALIPTLHSEPNGVCDDSCSNESDRSLLMEWYNSYCSTVEKAGQAAPDTTSTTTTSTAELLSTSLSTIPTSPAPSQMTSQGPQSWWSTHYRWVIMLIVLAVGFTIIAVAGMYIKRRYDAKSPGLYHGVDSGGGSTGTLFNRTPGIGPDPRFISGSQLTVLPYPTHRPRSGSIPSEVTATRDVNWQACSPSRAQNFPQAPEADGLGLHGA